jgi:hypothetical protein
MRFVFDAGSRAWNPDTHTYTHNGDGVWLIDNGGEEPATEWYLTNGNNEITVTNHSNGAIDAEFSYVMLTGATFDVSLAGDATAFNAEGTDKNAVAGGFYASEDNAQAGALALLDPIASADFNTLTDSKISLPTAEGRAVDSDAVTASVFFAFSGTPDAGRGSALPEFRRVGAITVTISPNSDVELNTAGTE